MLAAERYRRLPKATIVGLDYSWGMLQQARGRFEEVGARNVILVHGDVDSLPMADDSVDLCLSMNGLHAFPEKAGALGEIHRVMRKQGRLSGCFYVEEKRAATDFLVRNILSKGGTFTAPFHNEKEAIALIGQSSCWRGKGT